MATVYRFTLPWPPSANRYWRNVRGHTVVSSEARDYKLRAAWEARIAVDEPLSGNVILTMDFYRPRKSGDLSNRIKVLEDALNGVAFNDDKQVIEIHARRFDDKHNPRVEVEVREAA